MNIKKALVTGAAVATILVSTAFPVLADHSAPLYGPNANFVSCSAGGTATPKKFGSVRINVSSSQVLAKVSIRRGLPSTTYDLWLNQDPGGCPVVGGPNGGQLKTDSKGNGWAWVLVNRVPGSTKFWISATGGGQVLRSPAVSGDSEDED